MTLMAQATVSMRASNAQPFRFIPSGSPATLNAQRHMPTRTQAV